MTAWKNITPVPDLTKGTPHLDPFGGEREMSAARSERARLAPVAGDEGETRKGETARR